MAMQKLEAERSAPDLGGAPMQNSPVQSLDVLGKPALRRDRSRNIWALVRASALLLGLSSLVSRASFGPLCGLMLVVLVIGLAHLLAALGPADALHRELTARLALHRD